MVVQNLLRMPYETANNVVRAYLKKFQNAVREPLFNRDWITESFTWDELTRYHNPTYWRNTRYLDAEFRSRMRQIVDRHVAHILDGMYRTPRGTQHFHTDEPMTYITVGIDKQLLRTHDISVMIMNLVPEERREYVDTKEVPTVPTSFEDIQFEKWGEKYGLPFDRLPRTLVRIRSCGCEEYERHADRLLAVLLEIDERLRMLDPAEFINNAIKDVLRREFS